MKRFFCFVMILCFSVINLCLSNAESGASLTILYEGYDYPSFNDYAAAGHDLTYRYGTFNDIATAIATHDANVDVFVFQTRYGLDQIKKQDYYYPLTENTALMDKLSDLYPAFRNALMDGDALIGWYVDAQAWSWQVVMPDILTEAEQAEPTTFDELIDVCDGILKSGLLGDQYTLIGEYPYTQESMLQFFMTQYLVASEAADGQVNFYRPEFARTAAKIKDTAPATSQESMYWETEIFTTACAATDLSQHMALIPSVLDGEENLLYYVSVVAVVNPYSDNLDAAVDFIEYLSTYESGTAYFWDSSLNKPHIRNDYEDMLANYDAQIARLEAIAEPTEDDTFELQYMREAKQALIDNPYDITAEDVAHYQDIVQYAYISGDSPVLLDDTLQTLIQRYLNGAYDADGFAEACQEHVNQIYQELGMEPVQKSE